MASEKQPLFAMLACDKITADSPTPVQDYLPVIDTYNAYYKISTATGDALLALSKNDASRSELARKNLRDIPAIDFNLALETANDLYTKHNNSPPSATTIKDLKILKENTVFKLTSDNILAPHPNPLENISNPQAAIHNAFQKAKRLT